MLKRFVRVLKVGALVGVAVGVIRSIRGDKAPLVTGQASWPPLAEEPPSPPRAGPVRFATESAQSWVEPLDGSCPSTHPIKANADSGIFHVPSGMSYERTVPGRCYAREADAEADGFRQAKR